MTIHTEVSRTLANYLNLYMYRLIEDHKISDDDIRLALLEVIDMYNNSSYKDKIEILIENQQVKIRQIDYNQKD